LEHNLLHIDCVFIHAGKEGQIIHMQPEGAQPGTTKPVTIGKPIRKGMGNSGEGHNVQSHQLGTDQPLVVKQFHIQGLDHPDVQQEAANLRKVGQLAGTGEVDGKAVLAMHKVPGTELRNTQAYQNTKGAKSGPEHTATLAEAKRLAEEKALHHAANDGVMHQCVFFGNLITASSHLNC
jgi:hypothetical protein